MIWKLLYSLYERRLAARLPGDALPEHIGVILDGNRRYAREHRLGTPGAGHRLGADKVHELVDWCDELDVPYVTLWLLSSDNLQRATDEVGDLVGIVADTVARLANDPRNRARGIRVTAVGALDALPERLQHVLKEADEQTEGGTGLQVQVAVGYGGRQEITAALRGLLEERHAHGDSLEQVIDDLSEDAISRHLYTNGTPDPDLIIRTSGEIRLSGFLLWQSANSEFYFCDPYWPEFRKTDFLRALRDYASRQRRYGK